MIKPIAFILLLIFLLLPSLGFAQSVRVDSASAVELRIPEESKIEAYANNPDFIYQEVAENPNSLGQRIFSFLINTLLRILNNPLGNFFMKMILFISVIGLVFALINQLMGGELITLFKSDKNKGFSLGINKEELENTDFEQLLQQSLLQKDYHAATRYVYLISLQMLANKGLITWSLEKTNLDFLHELTGHPLKDEFSTLTTTYEYVEYGDFEINTTQFNRYRAVFEHLKRQLNE